jgi:hypothetical protein
MIYRQSGRGYTGERAKLNRAVWCHEKTIPDSE